MVSHTPLNGSADATLPRRDLIAILAFLNRNNGAPLNYRDPFEQAEGILQQLASAARMQ